ncbi:MAG: aminopeptidase P family protein [Lachnospiraceae bacterium]|nr:aminopeptidase P family protein [Lachnospiraceae bacterium]
MKKEIMTLAAEMKAAGLNAYIVTSSDSHASEYVHPHFRYRAYASGFTGSAGTLLVLSGEDSPRAYLWTDSRYYLQAGEELSGSGIELFKAGLPSVPTLDDFLLKVLPDGATVGADTDTIPCKAGLELTKKLSTKNIQLTNIDLAEKCWNGRPALSCGGQIRALPDEITGESAASKISRIREAIKSAGADAHVITALDDIAWILNMRGLDISYSPVFYSRMIVTQEECRLYAFKDAFGTEDLSALSECGTKLYGYDKFGSGLSELSGLKVLIDTGKTSLSTYEIIRKIAVPVIAPNPSNEMKAVKNGTEIKNLRAANELDGAAMVKFIYEIKKDITTGGKTDELRAGNYLDSLRIQKGAFSPSFETIAGYGEHGAIVHYSADKESSATLEPHGFFLVDSGGHYEIKDAAGTTDITRTIALGPLTDEMKDSYTRVLMGMIDIAKCVFPEGTTGKQLDTLAHKYLWEAGLDYGHGTGHGIGYILNVHEGPQNISPRGQAQLRPGMVTSDEPGVYLEGKFGVRIENDILCVRSGREGFLGFETLTLCPFETDAIKKELLDSSQISFINEYHKTVFERLSPYLSEEEKTWLESVTRPI